MTYLHTIDGLDVLLWLLAYAAWRYLTAPRRPKPKLKAQAPEPTSRRCPCGRPNADRRRAED